MSTQELISLAKRYGITFFFEDGKVVLEAAHRPEGKARELIELLRARKEAVLDALHREVDLECMARKDPTQNEDDPIVPEEAWLPEYLSFRKKVYQQVKDTNIWGYARTEKPELYIELKKAEAEMDALTEARLSKVMELLKRWQGVMLKIHGMIITDPSSSSIGI